MHLLQCEYELGQRTGVRYADFTMIPKADGTPGSYRLTYRHDDNIKEQFRHICQLRSETVTKIETTWNWFRNVETRVQSQTANQVLPDDALALLVETRCIYLHVAAQ